MDFANLVVSQAIGGLPALIHAGTQRFKELEAGASLLLRRGVRGRASYRFHDARFRDCLTQFDGVPTQLAAKRLELSARHLASADLVVAPERGLRAGAEVNCVGSRFLNRRNTALAPDDAAVAAWIGYRTTRWELRMDGGNLTNTRPPVAESELGDAQYYLLPARRIDVTWAVGFGRRGAHAPPRGRREGVARVAATFRRTRRQRFGVPCAPGQPRRRATAPI